MFNINSIDWYIKYRSNIYRSDGSETIGMTDGREHIIYLHPMLRGGMFEKVLCHELVHAFMFSYDIQIDLDTEEFIADFFSVYGKDMIYLLDDLLSGIKKPGISGRA